jgi:hypothetical protein
MKSKEFRVTTRGYFGHLQCQKWLLLEISSVSSLVTQFFLYCEKKDGGERQELF